MTDLATERQVGFITSLAEKKDIEAAVKDSILAILERGDLIKKDASKLIDELLAKPDRPRAGAAARPHLDGLPGSKYAIPAEEFDGVPGMERYLGTNDLLFVSVRKWRDRVYLDQLHGAPGGFSKTRFALVSEVTVADTLRRNPSRFAKLFALEYSCCARCGADLTDQFSRELGLGPTCRQEFGL